MTRIVSGKFRGRRLAVPKGRDVRPTTDRMRERLFSMLTHHRYPDMQGARVADLYAGTGALGLEALSRGAAHVTFVEKAPASLAVLSSNIDALKVTSECKILKISAQSLPATSEAFDFIFMDPPYRKGHVLPTLQSLLENDWLKEDTVIICELASDEQLELPNRLSIADERSQGQQRILFLTLD